MLDTQSSWNYAQTNTAYDAINNYAQSFVDVVRATGGYNAQRNLTINTYGACSGMGTWSTKLQDPLKQMNKPTGESNHLILQVHTYPDISNLNTVKTQINQMISDLNTQLVSKKGAPVIIGEWGTSNVDAGEGKTDYDIRREQMFQFVDYFIKKAKENNIATFYWMGLSDGMSRLYPAFYQSDLALRMLKAYHGDDYSPTLPDVQNYNDAAFTATINYWSGKQWAEFNLFKGSISSSDYQGIQLELETAPTNNELQFKVIGKNTTTSYITQASSSLTFTSAMGTITNNLHGQRITTPQKGIYIKNGKKLFLK